VLLFPRITLPEVPRAVFLPQRYGGKLGLGPCKYHFEVTLLAVPAITCMSLHDLYSVSGEDFIYYWAELNANKSERFLANRMWHHQFLSSPGFNS
jgi:hypothetical protein